MSSITLHGSAEIVTEFFDFAVNNILYTRGVYPPEEFERKQKYGLTMLMTADAKLQKYIEDVLSGLKAWLQNKAAQKVVLVMADSLTGETVERWQFDITTVKGADEKTVSNKPVKEIQGEIKAIMKQIMASVTLLPILENNCTFELLMYTDKDATVPITWQESDAKQVKNAELLQFRQFSTDIHKVQSAVTYRGE